MADASGWSPVRRRVLIGAASNWLAFAATLLASLFGLAVGLVAGYSRSQIDPFLMRTVDVMLAFPPLLFLLWMAFGKPGA